MVNAAPGTVVPAATLGGLIVPFQNVQLQSTLAEPADRVNVREGDRVRAGEVIAQLDTSDLVAQLNANVATAASDRAKANQTYFQAKVTISQNSNSINSAQATLRQAQQTLAKDTLDLQRDTQLLSSGYISQQAYDQQRTLVANDQQAVRTAQVNVQNQQTQVAYNGTTSSGLQGAAVAAAQAEEQTALAQAQQIRAQIAKATITSPVDGIVVNRNLNPGEYPGTRQIFTIQETDKVFAVLNGSGNQVVGVRPGTSVTVNVPDRAELHGRGTVAAVLDQVTPGSTNFSIKVLLPNPTGSFRSGMVVSGTVTRPPVNGIRIPDTAFTDETRSSVQTISNGTVKTVNVTLLADDGKNAVVRGLAARQPVIANGQLGLNDGQSVTPLPSRPNVAER